METQAVNFPRPMAEFLDMIKEKYEGHKLPPVYKIVKIPARYDGSASVLCDTEIVYDYNDLCVKMFDLDVSGWEISERIASEKINNLILGGSFNVVTIRITRTI